jgi:predicted nucleic acid-binding protein
MTKRSFVDTNVLVYRFDHGEPAKRAVAKRLLDNAVPGPLVISTQVLEEFYVITTRKLARPLRPDQASEAVEPLSALPVVGADADFVRSGIDLSRTTGLSSGTRSSSRRPLRHVAIGY